MQPTVIVTLPAYTIGKALGVEEGMRELQRQIQSPDAASLPAVRLITRLRRLADLHVRLDTGGTHLCLVRSRHAHEAWTSGADVWFSVDDDNDATQETIADMLTAVEGPEPRIVIAPYIVRGEETRTHVLVNVDLPRIVTTERQLPSGARLRPVSKGGFGLVAMNRAALAAVRGVCGHLLYRDTDEIDRLALFSPEIMGDPPRWLADDFSFFARVPAHVHLEALLTGHTSHAGERLDLSTID